MTALDDKLVPVATKLLAKFGADAVFKIFQDPVIDIVKGGVYTKPSEANNSSQSQENEHTWKMTPPLPNKKSFSEDNVADVRNMTSFIAAENIPFTPVNGMEVTFKGETLVAMEVTPYYSGESIAIYELRWQN